MDNVLTATCTHKNNPTGAALATVETDIAISPLDALDRTWSQQYPIEKQFIMRQAYTKYTAFQSGDYLVYDSVTFAIRTVHFYAAQGGLDAYYFLVLEWQSGS